MQHDQVIEENLVEQYLLGEMSEPQRDAFEEHYFECHDCAADVRATSAFMDIARNEFAAAPVSVAAPVRRVEVREDSPMKQWWASLWSPAFGFGLAAACLLLVAYQNVVTVPHLTTQVAQLEAPGVLPTLSLAGAANRGGNTLSAAIIPGQPLLAIELDIPSRPELASYTCNFYNAGHVLVGSVQVPQEQTKDTVSVRIPAATWGPGQYSVEVRGNGATGTVPVDVARYTFALTSGPSTSAH